MKTPTSKNELKSLINTVYDAVNESKAGPMRGTDENGKEILGYLPIQCFLALLNKMIPNGFDMKLKEAGESWKGDDD